MRKIKQIQSNILLTRYGVAYMLLVLSVLFSMVTRIIIMLLWLPQLDYNIITIVAAFGIGLFYDVVAGLFFVAPLMVYLWLCPSKLMAQHWHKYILYAYCVTSLVILVFNMSGEILFWQEYQNRYDFIAVDYLIYTFEVVNNIIESYPVVWILAGVFLLASLLFILVVKYVLTPVKDIRLLKRTGITICFAVLTVFNYVVVTNQFKSFTHNNYTNELAGNGLYEFGTAYFNNEINFYAKYATVSDSTAFTTIHNLLYDSSSIALTTNPLYSLQRNITPDSAALPYNVVLISVESLSASFMQYFGSTANMTPVLDSLIPHSILYSNLYATGTRTVRGLEALSLAIAPTPGQSIVRRPNNNDMYTIGNVLQQRGYDCRYIYGGNSFFDNMGPYFSSNGYQVVDQRDFGTDEVTFTTAWGACDEDILNKALKTCDESYGNKKLFFNHVMTVSNHRPFTYPKGKISSYNPDDHSREGAVAYTDWAIGNFLKQASTKPWYAHTIFLIVADHCANAAGKTALPLKGYHIPALMYCPQLIQPKIETRLTSQIDLLPTLLGIMNVPYQSKFMGYNMATLPIGKERAMISTYQKLGYVKNNTLAILTPKQGIQQYKVDYATGNTTPLAITDSSFVHEAISWYQVASYCFKHGLYKK